MAKSLKRSIDHAESAELLQSYESDPPEAIVDQFDFGTFYQYAMNGLISALRPFLHG
jgi:hypothetical protein